MLECHYAGESMRLRCSQTPLEAGWQLATQSWWLHAPAGSWMRGVEGVEVPAAPSSSSWPSCTQGGMEAQLGGWRLLARCTASHLVARHLISPFMDPCLTPSQISPPHKSLPRTIPTSQITARTLPTSARGLARGEPPATDSRGEAPLSEAGDTIWPPTAAATCSAATSPTGGSFFFRLEAHRGAAVSYTWLILPAEGLPILPLSD